MATRNEVINAIREMLDRNWDVYEIASRMKLDVSVVQAIIDLIT
jgi:hypothetical protein